MKLTFKNVLITGGAGFIGSNIASKLASKGVNYCIRFAIRTNTRKKTRRDIPSLSFYKR